MLETTVGVGASARRVELEANGRWTLVLLLLIRLLLVLLLLLALLLPSRRRERVTLLHLRSGLYRSTTTLRVSTWRGTLTVLTSLTGIVWTNRRSRALLLRLNRIADFPEGLESALFRPERLRRLGPCSSLRRRRRHGLSHIR
jgi:hypothetical protein